MNPQFLINNRRRKYRRNAISFICGVLFALAWSSLWPHARSKTVNGKTYCGTRLANVDVKNPAYTANERNLLLVGVMTAEKFVNTRAKAIEQTWAKNVPGKVLYFTGSWTPTNNSVPLVMLPKVNDTVYPPQRKFFRMLYYMYTCCLNKYQWFMRADDDLHVRMHRLKRLLMQLNSSKPLYLGQSGTGDPKDNIYWDTNKFFCMGGSGIVVSRALLAQVAPFLRFCAASLTHSEYDDVDFGRCVTHVANVQCTNSYELISLLINNRGRLETSFNHSLVGFDTRYAERKDYPFDSLLLSAATYHPVKDVRFHLRLSHFDAFQRLLQLERDRVYLEQTLVTPQTHGETIPEVRSLQLWQWQAYVGNMQYAAGAQNPAVGLKNDQPSALPQRLMQDVSLTWSKSERRRSAKAKTAYSVYTPQHYTHVLVLPAESDATKALTYTQKLLHARISRVTDYSEQSTVANVYLVLPVCSYVNTTAFSRFYNTFLQLCSDDEVGNHTTLLLVLCQQDAFDPAAFAFGSGTQRQVKVQTVVVNKTSFSRAEAMNAGAAYVHSLATQYQLQHKRQYDAIVFFVDVDMQLTKHSLLRVRYNTAARTAYYPIVLSGFEGSGRSDNSHSHSHLQSEFDARWFPHASVGDQGAWAFHGYGMVAMHVSDWFSYAKWNEAIVSWGLEDVELHDRLVLGQQLQVLRTPDPALAHAYHSVNCTQRLVQLLSFQSSQSDNLYEKRDRYRMCLGSQYSHARVTLDLLKSLTAE